MGTGVPPHNEEIDPSQLSALDIVRGLARLLWYDESLRMFSPGKADRILKDPKRTALMLEAVYTFLSDTQFDPWSGQNATHDAKASRFLLPLLGRYIKPEEFDAPQETGSPDGGNEPQGSDDGDEDSEGSLVRVVV